MNKEIYINVDLLETRVAVLEDKRLEEFYVERHDAPRLAGSFYKGRVESILPGMGAAFVDIGLEKNGFLYVSDVIGAPTAEGGFDLLEDRAAQGAAAKDKAGSSISELLKKGDEVLVQIVKEPLGTKGARLTTHISLPGHFLVLMPFSPTIGISKRINDPRERERIKNILKELRMPKEMGLVVRTASQGAQRRELISEAKYLMRLWHGIKERAKRVKAPSIVYEEYELVLRVGRDMMRDDVASVEIDSRIDFKKLVRFLGSFSSSLRAKVRLYRFAPPIFEKYGVEEQVDKLYHRVAYLKSGGHLIIEQTESLVAIDVNSGKFVGRKNLEDTAFRTNMEAALEIAKQLRLRDLGGIIIIDFIDMEFPAHRQKVFKALEDAIARDKAKNNILSISSIGLVEMTRQRMRKSIEGSSYEKCPYCSGRGMIKSAPTVSIEAARKLEKFLSHNRFREVFVSVHPDVSAYISDPKRRIVNLLEKRFRVRIRVMDDASLHMEEVKIEGAR